MEGMLPFLSDKTIAGKINIHACMGSTNNTAKELAISGAEHGTIIIADYQTAGRGRYNRSFFSPPGHGIYMSIILRPIQQQLCGSSTLATLYAAVSVCESIETTTGKTPQIKWVNDVLLHGRKICGILSEAATDFKSGDTEWIVVGIGINFTTPDAGFPNEIKHTAGSLFDESKPTIKRDRLIAEVANRILLFENEFDNETTIFKYKKRLMMLGKTVTVTGIQKPFEALAVDIDHMGRLIIQKDNGEIIPLVAGEIGIKL